MTCNECRRQVVLAEGEPAVPSPAREHLAGCVACQEAVREDERLRVLLHELAQSEQAPAALREQVNKAMGRHRADSAGSFRRWIGIVAAALLLTVAAYGLSWYRAHRAISPQHLAQEFISDHLHYLPGREQIVSHSAPDVEQWFQGRVEFSVRVPQVPVASLEDAHVCTIVGRKAALLHYRRKPDERLISLFVTEAHQTFARQVDSEPFLTSSQGLNATIWYQRGLVYSLVAALDDASLRQIAESVRQQER